MSVNWDCRVGRASTSSNNNLIVTGAGSVLTNNSFLQIGDNGSGNRLLISEGGQVITRNVTIGAGTKTIK
ncbi:MAG: hypothetical protein ACXVM1_15110 [Flavisolibacter sp.]